MTRKTTFLFIDKLDNCVNRENYISSPDRQEKLIFSFSNVDTEYWKSLQYETELIAAREIVIEIPNQYKPEIDNQGNIIDDSRVHQFINDYTNQFYQRNGCDFIVGVHNNETNLHAHIMFNERTLEHPENKPYLKETVVPARYLVDGKRVKKAIYEKALEDGNPNTEYQPKKTNVSMENKRFSIKDEKYKTREWLENEKIEYTKFMNNQKDIENSWHREIPEGHKPQVHVGKGDPNKYPGIAEKIQYNEEVKQHNKVYDWIKEKGYDLKKGVESYYQKYKESLIDMKNKLFEKPQNNDLEQLKQELSEIRTSLKETIDRQIKTRNNLDRLKSTLKKDTELLKSFDKNILTRTINKKNIEILENKINDNSTKFNDLKKRYNQRRKTIDTLEEKEKSLEMEIAAIKTPKSAQKSEISGFSLDWLSRKEKLVKAENERKKDVTKTKIRKNHQER